MSFYTPNYAVGSAWQTTLKSAFSQLRKIKFAIEDTFSFGDFDPNIDFLGMTTTLLKVNRARYLKLGKLLFFSVNFSVTLAAPLTTAILVNIPYTAAGESNLFSQSSGALITNAVAAEVGLWTAAGGENRVSITRPGLAAYGAAASNISFNGFIEVI